MENRLLISLITPDGRLELFIEKTKVGLPLEQKVSSELNFLRHILLRNRSRINQGLIGWRRFLVKTGSEERIG